MNNQLPIKAQVLIYKVLEHEVYVLCLKRCQEDGGFWHVLTGTMEMDETLKGCMYREIKEEVGVDNILHVSKELNRYVWQKNDLPIWVIEYAIEISDSEEITLDHEHDAYRWEKRDEAMALLEKDSAKNLLSLSLKYIDAKNAE
jgi:8-oxo-dGTP pyrophosphatase MutT (NUDIX family)